MIASRMRDETLEEALVYAASIRTGDAGLLPREFYFRLRLNGHTSWPVFRSAALPTFPTWSIPQTQKMG